MADDHLRYERLAVGHVLGGLDSVDAAAFRSHLLGCRDCRMRVSELRGIASDLAAAERDERATAGRLATEVQRQQQQAEAADTADTSDLGPWRQWPWGVLGSALLVVGLLVVLVWNLGLRQTNVTLLAATEQREAVLRVLAEGDLLDATVDTGTGGLVAVDADTLVLDLADVRPLRPQEVLVVWQLGADGSTLEQSRPVTAGQIAQGRLAMALERAEGLGTVAVSVEEVPVFVEAPTGLRILTAEVPAGTGADAADGADGADGADAAAEPAPVQD